MSLKVVAFITPVGGLGIKSPWNVWIATHLAFGCSLSIVIYSRPLTGAGNEWASVMALTFIAWKARSCCLAAGTPAESPLGIAGRI